MEEEGSQNLKDTEAARPNRRPQTSPRSYLTEWQSISKITSLDQLKFWSRNGYLVNCRFTSICWNQLLNVLPVESKNWLSVIEENREQYKCLKEKLMVTPGNQEGLDLTVHNPLSQCQESTWNRYFEDTELKKLITLDVQRACPVEEYFQKSEVQDQLVSILFCYARKYPQLSYIQGMHEVLAPLLYVTQMDRDTCKQSTEDLSQYSIIQIMNENYVEHDTFFLFEAVMGRLRHWYQRNDAPMPPKVDQRTKLITAQPFSKPEEAVPTPKIVQRLMRLQEVYLKAFENDVYQHLTELQILPQVYGIRWGRLMVGREFQLMDLLLIWDAVFSDDGVQFELLDFIMVAMLAYIKPQILGCDYSSTLKLLMSFPTDCDVRSIIKMAQNFQANKDNPGTVRSPHRGSVSRNLSPNPGPRSTATSLNRSSSVPRRPENLGTVRASRTKLERHESIDRRKSSPTVEATHSLNVSFNRRGQKNGSMNNSDEMNGKKSALFGNMFAKPKEMEYQKPDACIERPLKDIVVIKRSEPIPTANQNRMVAPNRTSESDDGSPSVTANKKKIEKEDLLTTSLNCASRLEHYQDKLRSRLAEMNLQSDLCIRTALDGISEVIESLRETKLRPRNPSGPDPYATELQFTPRRSKSRLDNSKPTVISHPLMDASP